MKLRVQLASALGQVDHVDFEAMPPSLTKPRCDADMQPLVLPGNQRGF